MEIFNFLIINKSFTNLSMKTTKNYFIMEINNKITKLIINKYKI